MGAGNDALPLVSMARQLGWFVAVVDGRAHLATAERFPEAEFVQTPTMDDLAALKFDLRPSDAVAILTHSFEQDALYLAALLKDDGLRKIAYLGMLGPRQRTRELLAEAAKLLGREPEDRLIEEWMAVIHSPMGLDLGGAYAAAIALSTLAEIQQKLTASSARPLREVRR
jgi:xanthine/CO dehydrogenase XdhC/CoxF family maturation factor